MPPARAPAPARALPGPLVEAVKGVVLAHLATTSGGAATFVALARAVRAAKRSGSIAIPVPERQIDAAIKALLASGVLVQAGDGTISIGRQGTPAASNPPAIAALVKEIVTTYLAEHVHATSETLATHVRDARRLGSLATSSEQVEAAIKALIDSGDVVQAGDENELFLSPALATAAGPPGPVPGMTARQYDEARRFVVRRFEDFATICTFNELVPPDDHVYFPREIYSDKALRDAVWHVLRSGGFVVEEGSCEGYSTVTTSERVAWYREQRAMIAERWLREGIPAREADAVADLEAEIAENLRVIDPAGFHAEYKPYDFKDPEEWVRLVDAFFNCHCLVENGHVVGLWISDDWTTRTPDPPNPRHMALRRIPASIGDIVHLRYLHIRNYHALAPLPASITRLVDLEVLVLGNAFEGTLPAGFGNLRRLRTLYLEGQGDPAGPGLPGSLGDLANLEHLCLRCTGALPASIGNLASLRTLTIHESSLGSLPESFGDLRGLRYLDLRGSPISPGSLASLPESFGNLASLEHLDLSYNRLASLPDSFGNLRKLTTLLLKGNPLENLPQSCKFLDVLEETDAREMFLPLQSSGIEQHVSKELLRRLPHPGRVNTVAFSPNGDILASGSQDYTTRLWEARSGNLLGMLKGHEAQVSSIAFSPDGSKVVTCSYDSSVRIWAVPTGEPQHVLRVDASSEPFTSVAFSPDGSMVAAGSWDKCIHIWDPLDGKPLRVLEGHSKWVTQVSFSPDGTFLASISSDGTTRCWNPQDGTELHVVKGFNRAADAIAVSPNGEDVAISVSNIIHVIDVATGTTRFFLDSKFPASIFSLAYSPDGHLLAAGSSDKTVRIWDVSKREIVQTITDWFSTCMYGVAFSPDGTQVASGSESSGVCIWTVSY